MRHVRMLGLCLAAAFAVAAITAASASALPEFGKCEVAPTHEGKYTNEVCTKKAKLVGGKFTGGFEWKKASEISKENRHFIGSAGAGVLYAIFKGCRSETTSSLAGRSETCPPGTKEEYFLSAPGAPLKVECTSESNHGEISGNNAVGSVSVIFRGCTVFGTSPCSNTINEGEIQVNLLKGSIGFINKSTSPREVGLLLEPSVKRGDFARFSCLGGSIGTVVGEGDEAEGCAYPLRACGGDGIIAPMTPVNTMTSEFTQTFTVDEETAENIPGKLEGKPLKKLESYLFNTELPEISTQWSKAAEAVKNVAVDCVHPPNEIPSIKCPNNELEVGEIKAN